MNIREKAQELIEHLNGAEKGMDLQRRYAAGYATAHGREIARALIEALDVIKEMCDSAERYAAHANAHPERDHAAAMASVAERVVTAGTLFLARLNEKGDADNG